MKLQNVSSLARIGLSFALLLLSPQRSFAGELGTSHHAEASAPSASENVETDLKDYLKAIDKPIPRSFSNENDETLARWLRQKFKDYKPACRNFFIDSNNKLGQASRLASKALVETALADHPLNSPLLVATPQLERLCPGFKNMKPHQKISFFTWALELTAFPESSCKVDVHPNTAGTPNGAAVGLYQLNGAKRDRYWRGPHCNVTSVKDLTNNTKCTVDIMKFQVEHSGEVFGFYDGIDLHKAYWASWNPLSPTETTCFEKYMDSHGDPKKEKNKAIYQTACNTDGKNKYYMAEWTARFKFFHRIKRFPLCETAEARKEIASLPK